MRLTINKDELLKSLLAASKASPMKSANPILVNLKMELTEKGFEITGTDQAVTIKSTVPYMKGDAEIIKDGRMGATLVNAHIMVEAIKRIENPEISLDVIDGAILKVDDGRSSFKLNCLNADEYADIDLSTEGSNSFSIPSCDFVSLIDKTAFAVATRSQHMVLTCVRLEASERTLISTSTNSARLSRATYALDTDVVFGANIPGKTLLDIVHLFDHDYDLRVYVNEKKILFEYDNLIVSSSLITGAYPPVANVIPKIFNHYLEINAHELISAIDRARVVSSEEEPVVKMSMKDEEIEISARSDASGSCVETINTFRFTGETLSISFNSQFVVDAVRAVGGEDITFCFVGEMKPFAIKNPKDESIVEIITPMRTY